MHRRGFFGALLGLVGVAVTKPAAKSAVKVQPWVDGLWYFAKRNPPAPQMVTWTVTTINGKQQRVQMPVRWFTNGVNHA